MSHAPEKLTVLSVEPALEIAGPVGALALAAGSAPKHKIRGFTCEWCGAWHGWAKHHQGHIRHCTKRPPRLVRERRTSRTELEKAWLKQQLDELVQRGELTCDSLGRYGLPEWNEPNNQVSRGA